MVTQHMGHIYVRYTYSREDSPLTFPDGIGETTRQGLDLSGNTWYNLATRTLSEKLSENSGLGTQYVYYDQLAYMKTETQMDHSSQFETLTNYGNGTPGLSDKRMLWRFVGDDPYAIRIYNGSISGKYLSGTRESTTFSFVDENSDADIESFFLLRAKGQDDRMIRDDQAGISFFISGQDFETRQTQSFIDVLTKKISYYSHDAILKSGYNSTWQCYLLTSGSGGTSSGWVSFYKAPVARKYRYHAYNKTKGEWTWTATFEHDWLMPLVLEDKIARLYCKYEKNNVGTTDDVTGSNDFDTRTALEALNNAQFYSNEAMTQRVFAEDETTHAKTYDVYPAIDTEKIFDIYFKYEPMTNEEIAATDEYQKMPFKWSDTDDIKTDVTTRTEDGILKEENIKANWYFMVLDTDEDITATGSADSRTFTGRQQFLRREDSGMVGWLNSKRTLHKENVDNLNNWSYNRLAESTRNSDHDPFREARWLWAFVGDDPYDMRIINFESALGINSDYTFTTINLPGADNCYTRFTPYTVTNPSTGSTTVYNTVRIPTEEPSAADHRYYQWGLHYGYDTEKTLSLLSTAVTAEVDGNEVNQLLYWQMTADSVTLQPRASLRQNAIQLLPYKPTIYEDVKLVIRRDDEVKNYKEVLYPTPLIELTDGSEEKKKQLDYLHYEMKTGLASMYFAAETRRFVAGDEMSSKEMLPFEARRKFCDYTSYGTSDFRDGIDPTADANKVQAGPYRGEATGSNDAENNPIYNYYFPQDDGTTILAGTTPQTLYVMYKVTSDLFLTENALPKPVYNADGNPKDETEQAKQDALETEVTRMAHENDHVFFMDFTMGKEAASDLGYDKNNHAYFKEGETFYAKLPDKGMFSTKDETVDARSREWERAYWDATEEKKKDDNRYATETSSLDILKKYKWNDCEFQMVTNRMETDPKNLKWYFVGDPYHLQVFNTAKPGANLCRFDETESNFRAVIDCVHLRYPDNETVDPRREVPFYDPLHPTVVTEYRNNLNYNRPFCGDFYWQMMETGSELTDAFALCFRDNNQLVGLNNIYYYLVNEGTPNTEIYSDAVGFKTNLQYELDNAVSSTNEERHKANDKKAVIRLLQPARVYVSAYKKGSTTPIVQDEASDFFAVGETLTDVPRHLKRPFVSYSNLRYEAPQGTVKSDNPSFPFTLSTPAHLHSSTACDESTDGSNEHPLHEGEDWSTYHGPYAKVFRTGHRKQHIFKLRVDYELTERGQQLFTDNNDDNNYLDAKWIDVQQGDTWLYYNKTEQDTEQPYETFWQVTSSPDNGWSTGLKGLHWALIGDPYSFQMLNRRRYEDITHSIYSSSEPNYQWLGTDQASGLKSKIEGHTDEDSLLVYARLQSSNALPATTAPVENFGTASGNDQGNTTWGLVYYKTSADNGTYFLRTASLKTDEGDDPEATGTNGYQRLVTGRYPSKGDVGTGYDDPGATIVSNFILVDFSLAQNTTQGTNLGTATVDDGDHAKNDCFDANIYVYMEGSDKLKASGTDLEVRFTSTDNDVVDVMPHTLKRYGCNYKCYVNYNPATGEGVEVTEFLKDDTDGSKLQAKGKDGNIYTINDATYPINDDDDNGLPNLYYVYTYESMAKYFTTEDEAVQRDHTWANAYFQWTYPRKSGSGSSSTDGDSGGVHWGIVGYSRDEQGNINGWKYGWVANGTGDNGSGSSSTTTYIIQNGWMNSHTTTEMAYGDNSMQNDEDAQKWAFVGDPYDFTLTNYAKYLQQSTLALVYNDGEIDFAPAEPSHWALALGDVMKTYDGKNDSVDASGQKVYKYYLALIDDATGAIQTYITFDHEDKNGQQLPGSQRYLLNRGGISANDPTGNGYNLAGAKNFNITDLLSHVRMIIYHLVISHQHAADYEDTSLTTEQKRLVRQHMAEYLHYHHGKEMDQYLKQNTTYFNYKQDESYMVWDFKDDYINSSTGQVTDEAKSIIMGSGDYDKRLLKNASLRDLVSFPVPNYRDEDVATGRLKLPWYMARQFCDPHFYQRGVLRSQYTKSPETHATMEIDGQTKYVWLNETTGEAWYNTAEDATPPSGFMPVYNDTWEPLENKYTLTDGHYYRDGVLVDDDDPALQSWKAVMDNNGRQISRLTQDYADRIVLIDVVYNVKTDEFRFSDQGRNTTAWYSMMTNNEQDGLMNFSYLNDIGARPDRTVHYTNNYLWAPVGDPYGFVLHNRYATLNGTGWDNIVVTTTKPLPATAEAVETPAVEQLATTDTEQLTYTKSQQFFEKRVKHITYEESGKATAGATNAIYEMFVGGYDGSFLMHPVSAYVDATGSRFGSFYMVHDADNHTVHLKHEANINGQAMLRNPDANWRLITTPDQLLPYFERSGYVGGLRPTVALRYEYQQWRNKLKEYKTLWDAAQKLPDDYFTQTDAIRQSVYAGHFYKRSGNTYPQTAANELQYSDPRPGHDNLPLKFVSTNLVPLQQGYYRIEAFSQDKLDDDANDAFGTGVHGIQGPRFISGYRFESEKNYAGYEGEGDSKSLATGSRWLHFFETDQQHTTFNTFKELNDKVGSLDVHHDRSIEPHPAMRGNIPILPADYDPASIFYFNPVGSDPYERFNLETQNLRVRARAGGVQQSSEVTSESNVYGEAIGTDEAYGMTKLVDTDAATEEGFDERFRLADIGGTAVTLSILQQETANWDADVAQNLKTNYLCIDGNHRYRVTVHKNNEMMEIGDKYATQQWTPDGISYGIQDTKWLLKPVGSQEEWPYNEMPLRLEVKQGNAHGTDDNGNPLYYWFASTYLPFDSRLSNTTDVAFTLDTTVPEEKAQEQSVTLRSVSQLNNMGNPQYIPAGWPVIVRSDKVKSFTNSGRQYNYVNLYLPNSSPNTELLALATNNTIKLKGSYLERSLTTDDIPDIADSGDGHPVSPTKAVMVFGRPFAQTGGINNTTAGASQYYGYDAEVTAPGFYTNENWWRGHYYEDSQTTATANDATLRTAFLAEAQGSNAATMQQRSNTYVYHNKVFYVYPVSNADPAIRYVRVVFDDWADDDEEQPEQRGVEEGATEQHPWPCPVFDLQGRRVADHETPATLLQNHPALRPGVYIFGGRKVVVK
ncbi:MAG: hypothetical protein IJ841_04265 [Prevotella sp.]|nr:hypothetical protein [Prevotella sp.]